MGEDERLEQHVHGIPHVALLQARLIAGVQGSAPTTNPATTTASTRRRAGAPAAMNAANGTSRPRTVEAGLANRRRIHNVR